MLDTARDFGRDVPCDIAVMGFDNWEVLFLNSRPELTSHRRHPAPARRLVIRGSTVARR